MGMSPEALKRAEKAAAKATDELMGGLLGGATDPYTAARGEFTEVPLGPVYPYKGKGSEVFSTSPSGKIIFQNGVIADPTNSQVLYGTLTAPGSPLWLSKVQEEWDQATIKKWRSTLADQGYEVSATGGWARDLVIALQNYHHNRYLNFGKAIPETPGGKGNIKNLVKDAIDPVVLKEEVKAWGQVPFEEELDPQTADYFADRIIQVATKLAKKNPTWTMEQIQGGAQTRVQKEFIETPGVGSALREAEHDEASTKIRESLVGIAQLNI